MTWARTGPYLDLVRTRPGPGLGEVLNLTIERERGREGGKGTEGDRKGEGGGLTVLLRICFFDRTEKSGLAAGNNQLPIIIPPRLRPNTPPCVVPCLLPGDARSMSWRQSGKFTGEAEQPSPAGSLSKWRQRSREEHWELWDPDGQRLFNRAPQRVRQLHNLCPLGLPQRGR